MPKITEMFAFVSEDAGPDDEGVAAFLDPRTEIPRWMPMVAADRARVDALRQKAREIAAITGKSIRLVRFSVREELETIHPPEKNR